MGGFEGAQRFEEFGINVRVLQPGQSSSLYHRENAQEAFLVISGSAVMAGHEEMLPGTVHYTDAGTPYGPFTAGPDGLVLMVIRPKANGKGKRIPTRTVIDKVKAAQVAARAG